MSIKVQTKLPRYDDKPYVDVALYPNDILAAEVEYAVRVDSVWNMRFYEDYMPKLTGKETDEELLEMTPKFAAENPMRKFLDGITYRHDEVRPEEEQVLQIHYAALVAWRDHLAHEPTNR